MQPTDLPSEAPSKNYMLIRGGIVLVAIALVVSIVAGAFLWKKPMDKGVGDSSQKLSEQAKEAHHSGNFDLSISLYQELIKQAPDPDTMAVVNQRLTVSADLFMRNKADDRILAVQIDKDIIQNKNIVPWMRASSVYAMLDFFNGSHDEEFAKKVIFTGEVFGPFMKEGDKVDLAMRRGYEYANALYPLPMVSLRIANWYSNALNGQYGSLAPEVRVDYYQNLKKWSEDGERLLDDSIARKIPYETSQIGYMYQMKALARVGLAHNASSAEVKKTNFEAAESAFKKALEILAPEDEFHTYNIGLFVRFHYAASLIQLAADNGVGRIDDIKILLEPIIHTPERFTGKKTVFEEFLKNETLSEHDDHGHKKDLQKLSQMVPSFQAALLARGVDLTVH